MNFARGAACTEEDVQKIVQEVFVKVAQNYHRFRGEARVRTWILTIARDVITDYWRKQSRRAKHKAEDIVQTEFEDMRSPYAIDPLDYTITQDAADTIRGFIGKLPQNMRLVVLCRIYQSFSAAETAHILGWSQTRVRVTYSRALRKLRAVWPQREAAL